MSGRKGRLRARIVTLGVAAIGVVAIAGTALAGHQTSGVKSYTGCLVSGDGVLVKIKEGNTPKSACTGGQVEAHFSGGDITKIAVGNGLSLSNGGDNGEVRIVLDASHTLPQNCTTGRMAEWNGSAWVCGVDNDTTYTAGTGLDLSAGNAFSIESEYRVKNTPDCPSGQFATGFDSAGDDTGEIRCAAPQPSTSAGFFSRTAPGSIVHLAGTMTVLSEALPAGNYLLFAHVETYNPSFSSDYASGGCTIPNDSASVSLPDDDDATSAEINGNLTLVGAVVHSGGTVGLTCTETHGNIDILGATFAAIEVGSLG
jgi:hypothetical protein